MDESGADVGLDRREGPPHRVVIGTRIISLLGVVFGFALGMAGSLLEWQSDAVLGLYGRSGWDFRHLVAGDGKLTLAVAALGFTCLVVGALTQTRNAYLGGVLCAAFLLVVAVYEIFFLLTRPGVLSPGHGLYMLLGAGVVGVFCSLAGYLMLSGDYSVSEKPSITSEKPGDTGPQDPGGG